MPITPAAAARLYIATRRKELTSELEELDKLERQLSGTGGTRKPAPPMSSDTPTKSKRKPMSPAARKALSDKMKAQWAAKKK